MKALIVFIAALLCLHTTVPASTGINNLPENIARLKELNEKAYKTFIATYKSAEDVRVSADGDNTFVYCKHEGVETKILYNKKGKQVYSLKYFSPSQLPSEVTDLIKDEFARYTILHGTEVTNERGTAFLVNISYKNKFKTIRIADGRYNIQSQFYSQQ